MMSMEQNGTLICAFGNVSVQVLGKQVSHLKNYLDKH